MMSKTNLPNFPITIHDITIYFGTDLLGVRGKILRKNPIRLDTEEYVTIPKDLYKLKKFVTLTADVMFVNRNSSMIMS